MKQSRYYYIPYDVCLMHEDDIAIYKYGKDKILAYVWRNMPLKFANEHQKAINFKWRVYYINREIL